jgi:hypothetical protein
MNNIKSLVLSILLFASMLLSAAVRNVTGEVFTEICFG